MHLPGRAATAVLALEAAAAATLLCAAPAAASDTDPLPPSVRFFAPPPVQDAQHQVRQLRSSGHQDSAGLVSALVHTPQAVWLVTRPTAVAAQVRQTLQRAADARSVPVLVLYDVPGRDCAQYSAGGAGSDHAYRSWVDAVVSGFSTPQRAVVVVEPDGLANLPSDCPSAYPGKDASTLTASRIADIRYAATAVREADPEALVYLDAGNSAWRSVGEMARRLDEAGVRDVQGFALNVANNLPTSQQVQYGTWVAKCVYWVRHLGGSYERCAGQADAATASDPSTRRLTSEWYAEHVDAAHPGPSQLPHLVVDTSRNGRGPWPGSASDPDPQTWCNAPGRGAGTRPTADTGSPLADAFLWVKRPGQSDGQCDRGVPGSTTDPEWGGTVDPPAGQWFPRQALELARLATPPLS